MESRIRLEEFGKQLASLEESVAALETVDPSLRRLVRSAVIKDFELAYELCWKAGQENAYGSIPEVKSPREAFTYMHGEGFFDELNLAFDMVENRNRTTHIYREKVAIQVVEQIRSEYFPLLVKIYHALQG